MQFCNKSFCNGSKQLLFLPDNVHLRFQYGKKRSEYKTAFFTCIDQMVKGKKIAQTFPGEDRAIIGKAKGAFQA